MADHQGLIDTAKKNGHRVFKTKIAGMECIYRSLTRKEFRIGLFLANWDRYAGELGLKEEVEKKRKIERWGEAGKDDNVCGKIHKHINVIKQEILENKAEQLKREAHTTQIQ